MNLTISVITAVYNRADTIEQALDSVHAQTWPHIEYVVIDGGSTDGTLQILNDRREMISVLVSEPDSGIYDALNKGFSHSTGDIIGLRPSDDFYAAERVLERVSEAFDEPAVDDGYGDLDYVAKDDPSRIIRRWRSGAYSCNKLAWGWMPAHPTLYLRRRVIDKWGVFDTRFRIAADYDVMLRYLAQGKIRLTYIPEVLDRKTFQPVKPGERGELVLTSLGRGALPLLRYHTGDIVELGPKEPDSRGCHDMALIGGIIGRTDDMVPIRGVNVSPSLVENVMHSVHGVAEYRAEIFEERGLLVMRIQVEPTSDCTDTTQLIAVLKKEFHHTFSLRIPIEAVERGTLPRFEMKHKRWVRLDKEGN